MQMREDLCGSNVLCTHSKGLTPPQQAWAPLSLETYAQLELIWTNETVARVGNYVVSLPPGGLAEAAGGKCTCMSYVTSGMPCKHICLAALEKYKVSTPSHVERAIPAGYPGFPKAKAKAQSSAAKARGRAALEPETGPGRQVAFRPDDGSPVRVSSVGARRREGSRASARRGARGAAAVVQPASSTASSSNQPLALEDANRREVGQGPGCWGALAKIAEAIPRRPRAEGQGAADVQSAKTEEESDLASRNALLELKVKMLQASLREYQAKEAEREAQLNEEPWALKFGLKGSRTDAGGGQKVEFLPSAASMQERCVKLCLESGSGDVLWLIAFSFDRREVTEALSAAQKNGAEVLLVLDQKQTLQGPAEQQRIALQAAALGIKVQLASGDPLSGEYEKAGRGRMMSGLRGVCHVKGLLKWHGEELTLLTGSSNFTTSSRANREWSYEICMSQKDHVAATVTEWAQTVVDNSVGLDASRIAEARSQRARSASPGN